LANFSYGDRVVLDMLKNIQRENEWRRIVWDGRNILQSVKTLLLEPLPLYRIRFDASNTVTGRPQTFGKRPNARAEVDQIV
jgi:ubiquitin-protein ligase